MSPAPAVEGGRRSARQQAVFLLYQGVKWTVFRVYVPPNKALMVTNKFGDPLPPELIALTMVVLALSLVIAWFKDIPDMAGDRQFRVRTLTLRLGPRRALYTTRDTVADIDERVKQNLTLRFRLGEFDPGGGPYARVKADAAANGRLQSVVDNKNGTRTYHWFVSQPISNYNIALNVAPLGF